MVRASLFLLATLVAVTIIGPIDGSSAIAGSTPAVSVRLTTAETDCIVGGEAGCWDAAKQATSDCLESGLANGDLKSTSDVLDCYAYGGWTGVVCVFNWFLSLF